MEISEQNGKPFLLLRGAIDVSIAKQFRQIALQLAERGKDSEIGCEEVERLDSSAIQILLTLKEELKEKGKHLVLGGVPKTVANQLHLAGLAGFLLPDLL